MQYKASTEGPTDKMQYKASTEGPTDRKCSTKPPRRGRLIKCSTKPPRRGRLIGKLYRASTDQLTEKDSTKPTGGPTDEEGSYCASTDGPTNGRAVPRPTEGK